MSVTEAHTVVDLIVCKSPKCMMSWSLLSPLLFRATKRAEKMQHMLTIALHQISVFVNEFRKTGIANEALLEVAIEILNGSTCASSSEEDNAAMLPPKKRFALRARPVSVCSVQKWNRCNILSTWVYLKYSEFLCYCDILDF